MAVTITPSANSALSSELLLSGTLLIENAKDDGTETLAVSVYNKNTGATFTGTAQVYNTSKTTLTYTYANGTNFSVNLGTGNWVYQRLSTEVGNTVYTYIITFVWADIDGNISKTLTIETRENIIVNSFAANTLDDLDETITGVCDIDIINPSNVKITPTIIVNNSSMTGVPKILSTSEDVLEWAFVDGTNLVVNLKTKTFSYTRSAGQIGDKSIDTYNIGLDVDGVLTYANVASVVGLPPALSGAYANSAVDTDLEIHGGLAVTNGTGSSIQINITHNGILYTGNSISYGESLVWKYSDGSTFTINTSTNIWTYTRLAKDTQDLAPDTYVIDIIISNKYGTDSARIDIKTAIPTAEIISFAADNISDSDKTIKGSLKYELPVISNNPTLKVDVTVNGVTYRGDIVSLSQATIVFKYTNSSSFVYDKASESFTYSRSGDDYSNPDADNYIFECYITTNGETVTQSLSVKSLAGQRFYDYEPAYPINVQPSSVETQRTAWMKSVEETKRLYRLINENLNYYENLAQDLIKRMDELNQTFLTLQNKVNNIFDSQGRLTFPNGDKFWLG